MQGLTLNAKYTITEDPENYTSNKANNTATGTLSGTNITETFINTRENAVPTGIPTSAWYLYTIGFVCAAIGGIIAYKNRKKTKA